MIHSLVSFTIVFCLVFKGQITAPPVFGDLINVPFSANEVNAFFQHIFLRHALNNFRLISDN
jgi:hypothetical protein